MPKTQNKVDDADVRKNRIKVTAIHPPNNDIRKKSERVMNI